MKSLSHTHPPTNAKSPVEWTVSNRTILRILILALAFVVGVSLALTLVNQLIWIASAFFLSLALTPAVNWLARYMPRKSRGLAMAIVLVSAILVILYFIFALVPPVIDQLIKLVQGFPASWSDFIASDNFIARTVRQLNLENPQLFASDKVSGALGNIGGWIGGAVSSIFAFVTIFSLTFFMVLEGPHWIEVYWSYQDPKRRKIRQEIANDMYDTVVGYVTGNVTTSLIAAVCSTIMLAIIGIPSALPLGILVGVIDLIPLVGATIAAIIVTIFALVYGGLSAGIISAIFFAVYQLIENNVLVPIVFAKSVKVSPLVVGIAAICGGALAGFFGALVAVPVAASLQILVKHLLENRVGILDHS